MWAMFRKAPLGIKWGLVEMKGRGMSPDPNRHFKKEHWPDELYKDWEPKEKDLGVIRERIQQKISQKPNWYRWTKKIE